MKNKGLIKKVFAIIAALIVVIITAYLFIYVYKLTKLDNLESFEDLIASFGVKGFFIMLGLQIAQVVLAIIPGEPIELAMGALYGTFGGLALCLSGILIGTLLVFLTVRKLGQRFVEGFISSEKFAKLKFLKEPAKRDSLMFILMFIPGTPKDTLTYFAPFTGISLLRFLIISTVARIPSVISSTYIGSNLTKGNFVKSIIVFAIVGVISLAGILIYNKIITSKNQNTLGERNDKGEGTEQDK